jgi:hypothetical protein
MKNAANCASKCELQDTWTSTILTLIAVLGYCSRTTPGRGSFSFRRVAQFRCLSVELGRFDDAQVVHVVVRLRSRRRRRKFHLHFQTIVHLYSRSTLIRTFVTHVSLVFTKPLVSGPCWGSGRSTRGEVGVARQIACRSDSRNIVSFIISTTTFKSLEMFTDDCGETTGSACYRAR